MSKPDMTGITTRPTSGGSLRFRAEAWDNAAGRRIYKTFPTAAAARAWRRDVQTRIARGDVRAAEPVTIAEAYGNWFMKAMAGEVRSRGGSEYKSSVLHGYEITFRSRLLPAFGRMKVGELRRVAIQRYVDRLVAEGLAAQTIKNIATALRVLLRWCVREELIHTNPCDGLELPSGGEARERIASVAEALQLIDALPAARDRAILATAFFAGLRRGELMALRWSDVHLAERRIEVRQAYDPRTQTTGLPKSTAGLRVGENAPGVPDLLVPYLSHCFECGEGFDMYGPDWCKTHLNYSDGLVFGSTDTRPFHAGALARRCKAAWLEAGLTPIGLHEARHTYASICIAAGINIKTISTWMGHSSITITLDRYGHLLPGSAKEALGLLNNHLSDSVG